MKVFWALMAALVIATVVMFAGNRGGAGVTETSATKTTPASPARPPEVAADTPRASQTTPPPDVSNQAPVATVPTATSTATPDSAKEEPKVEPAVPPVAVQAPEAKQEPMAVTEKSEAAAPTPPPAPETVTAKVQPEEVPPALALVPSSEEENILVKLRQEIEAERAAAEARRRGGETPETPLPEEAPAATGPFGGAHVEERPDGSLLVEGKYLVSGKGTEADPYKVTWDHLISAERDYAPKDGKSTVPARIKALDGAWVEIIGYIAFPLVSDETDECLSMMNQWDGCCIGIPPTPYDAIEVRLGATVTGDVRLTTYGVIKGRFKVDPHLVGGWLVGMYVMDQAKLTPKAYGGVAP